MGDTIIICILLIMFALIFLDVYKIRKNTDELIQLLKDKKKED